MGYIAKRIGRLIRSSVRGVLAPPKKGRYTTPRRRQRYNRDRKVDYQAYLESDTWKHKRNQIMKMAGYKCRKCGAPAVDVHHETYRRLGNEPLTDLTAVCRNCHNRLHRHR